MEKNFELWKKGLKPMFIASFTINGNSGADNICYSEMAAIHYLKQCEKQFKETNNSILSEVIPFNPLISERQKYNCEDDIFIDCEFLTA